MRAENAVRRYTAEYGTIVLKNAESGCNMGERCRIRAHFAVDVQFQGTFCR
jgi:hypothetical protein